MTKTDDGLLDEMIALRKLSVEELRSRYLEVFGEETNNRNKEYLFKRIAYRLQEMKYGGLSQAALARAELLAPQAPVRRRPPPEAAQRLMQIQATGSRDPRLPPAGTVLHRMLDGVDHAVTVLDDGFEYKGDRFTSLSVIASKIAGTRWNGYAFFRLSKKEDA